jgi:fatty acyl-CoA reductase
MTAMDEKSIHHRKSNILELFRGSQVLITGGTGFMGQILMEKLLRSCQIDKLYLIIRPKKGLTEKERLNKIFNDFVSLCILPISLASNSQTCSTDK